MNMKKLKVSMKMKLRDWRHMVSLRWKETSKEGIIE
jgi:hypothetical protein